MVLGKKLLVRFVALSVLFIAPIVLATASGAITSHILGVKDQVKILPLSMEEMQVNYKKYLDDFRNYFAK